MMGSEGRKPKRRSIPLFRRLTSVQEGMQAHYEAHGARALRALLLILLLVSALLAVMGGVAKPPHWELDVIDLALAASVLAGWLLSFLLSGTSLYRAVTAFSVVVSVAAILALTALNGNIVIAYFLVIPLMISGLFLSARFTALVALASMGGMYTLPVISPNLSILNLIIGPIGVLSIAFSLLLMLLRQRDSIEDTGRAAEARIRQQAQDEIEARQRVEQRLIENAFADPLTGLPNKAVFADRMEQALLRGRRFGQAICAVMLMDIDNFKDINDSLGHGTGDELLNRVADRLNDNLRPGDTLARFGGDEFALLLESITDTREAEGKAERILESLRRPFYVNEQVLHISASIGIAITWSDYATDESEEILRDAEIAMYRAKEQGGSAYRIFQSPMREQLILRKQIEDHLRKAIQREQFTLHYQPISVISTGAIVGFEALVRWEHPERGLVSPAEFIPIAEATGMIVPIGRWVFRRACQQAREWRRRGVVPQGARMSVNFSPLQFKQIDFVSSLSQALQEDGLDGSLVNVEITENVLSDDPEHIIGCLTQLMALGMQVHLDDFGTGYSSLSQISQLPIHAIKIDRAFVGNLEIDEDQVELTRSIITMGHNVGLEIIAEGIETERQLEILRRLGADFGQGYYLSRPYPAEVIGAQMEMRLARA